MRWIFTKQNNGNNNYSSKYGIRISNKWFESTKSKMNSSPSMLHLLKSFIYPKHFSYSARPLSCHGSYRLLEGLKLCGESVGEVPLFLSHGTWSASFWHDMRVYNSKIYAVHLQVYIIHCTCFNDFCTSICDMPSLITVSTFTKETCCDKEW